MLVISAVLAIIKIPFLILSLVAFISSGKIVGLFIKDLDKKRKIYSKLTSFWSNIVLMSLGIWKTYKAPKNFVKQKEHNYLIVCNHLSYLDIMVISTFLPALFITSMEVKETFFIGMMSELGGSFFIERREITQIPKEIKRIGKTLEKGFDIVLFPEATTSNGEKILPFKKSFLSCAVEAKTPILPLCINYKSINGSKLSKKNRDKAFWYGDMDFFPHLFKLLFTTTFTKVELEVLKEISIPTDISTKDARKYVSEKAFQTINEAFNPL